MYRAKGAHALRKRDIRRVPKMAQFEHLPVCVAESRRRFDTSGFDMRSFHERSRPPDG